MTRYAGTLVIAGVTLAAFACTELFRTTLGWLALNPVLVLEGAWWQPLTYMYAHSGLSHLLFNLLFLVLAGLKVENRLGTGEFLLYYHVCGVLAGLLSLAVYWFTGQTSAFLLGSSGAVFAVIFAYAVYGFDGRTLFIPLAVFALLGAVQYLANTLAFSWSGLWSVETGLYVLVLAAFVVMIFKARWHQRASTIVLLFAAYEIFSQFYDPYGGVAHLTHLAGFVFGFLYLMLRLRVSPWKAFWAS